MEATDASHVHIFDDTVVGKENKRELATAPICFTQRRVVSAATATLSSSVDPPSLREMGIHLYTYTYIYEIVSREEL